MTDTGTGGEADAPLFDSAATIPASDAEAPAEDAPDQAEDLLDESPDEEPQADEESTELAAGPAASPVGDRYANSTPKVLPWQADNTAPVSEQARRFFGADPQPAGEESPDNSQEEEDAEDDLGGFGSVLAESYPDQYDKVSDRPEEEDESPEPEATEPPPRAVVKAKPTPPPAQPTPRPQPSGLSALNVSPSKMLKAPRSKRPQVATPAQRAEATPPDEPYALPWGDSQTSTTPTPPAEAVAETQPNAPLPWQSAPAPSDNAESAIVVDEPADPSAVASLPWASEPAAEPLPPTKPEVEPEAAVGTEPLIEHETLVDSPPEPEATDPLLMAETEPFVDVAPQAQPPVVDLAEPTTSASEPVDESPRVATLEPLPERKLTGPAIEPLPSVRVLPFNTRHLAWLLGGKLALAELADLDGATPTELAAWSAEVDRLAKQLDIEPPETVRTGSDPILRVKRLLAVANDAGARLAREQGGDHAALLEMSLKTNAVLVLLKDKPELAAPVARSIESAGPRAMLPRHLWERAALELQSSRSDADSIYSAVTELHERVEQHLR